MEMIIARESEKEAMLQKNLQLLPEWIRDQLSPIDGTELWTHVSVNFNEEGLPVCRYREDGKSFAITGRFPLEEAKRWCDGFRVRGAGGVFLFGSGFAYPIFELFDRCQNYSLIIVFEQNLYLFKAMLYYFDFEPLVKTGRLVFMTGNTEHFAGAFNHLFFSIAFAMCTSPVIAFTHTANGNFKNHYLRIHQFIFSQLALFVFYIGNDHLDNLVGFRNLIANSGEIAEAPYISCMRDKFKDVPAFIIANGPSLDKNIGLLHEIEGRGLVISTESAIVPLLRNGIKPDILTIIERTKYTYLYHFENIDYPEDMALICLGLVDQQVFPSFPGQKIPVFRNLEAINQWVNKYLGDGSAIDAGANVSHLAFEIAVLLGADPIVFVGQDYAYGPKGVTHSKDAVYQEEKGKLARDIIKSLPLVYLEANDGSQIQSNQIWKDFKTGLEQKIASHGDKTILNATEGGAKIEGTVCITLRQAIDEYCMRAIQERAYEVIAAEKAAISQEKRKEKLADFIRSAEEYVGIFRELSRISLSRKLVCRDMIHLSDQGDFEKSRETLETAYRENIKSYQMFIQDDLCRCFSQQIIFAYYYLMNRVGQIDCKEKMIEIFKVQHDFFYHLNGVFQSVSVHFEDAADFLSETFAHMDDSRKKEEHS